MAEVPGKLSLYGILISTFLLLCIFGVFIARKPLLVVGDEAFDTLYGESRIEGLRLVASLKLFRPIRRVRVDLSASSESIARSVITSVPHAYAAFFPARYEEAAKICSMQLRSLLLGASKPESENETTLLYVDTDRKLDFYRAGGAAAYFSSSVVSNVVLSVASSTSDTYIDSFKQGLKDFGSEGIVQIVRGDSSFSNFEDYSCIVIAEFEKNKAYSEMKKVPLIVFTWISPIFLPKESVVSFDDSVWVQLVALNHLLIEGQSGVLPSVTTMLNGRLPDLSHLLSPSKGLDKVLNAPHN